MFNCKKCGNDSYYSRGYRKGKRKAQCKKCKKYQSIGRPTKYAPKILLFDIETSPMEVYVWGLKYNNYISPENVIKDFSVLCWSAKWLFGKDVMGEKVSPEEAQERSDKTILKSMWELLDEADVVITQNGKKFDIPKLNARFLKEGFPPPMYYQSVDTKEVMVKNFGFSSNKLDYVNQFLGIEGKSEMVFEDWLNCLKGGSVAEEALTKMSDYNKKDVLIMEELYLRLRPWIPSHANLGIYADTDKNCCPNCMSTFLSWDGMYATPLGLYEAFRCVECGAIGRSTKKKYLINKVNVRN